MRKVIVFMMTTLDGFFAGPNGEIEKNCKSSFHSLRRSIQTLAGSDNRGNVYV